MKKSLFMMGVAVAALSSCTQSEVLNVADNNVIKFENAYVGKATRAATVLDNSNFGSFYVYGYNSTSPAADVFTGENVFKGDGTAWGYDNLKAYDEAAVYTFAAYSDGGTTKGTGQLATGVNFDASTTPATLKIDNYTTTDNKDLIVSFSHTNIDDANAPVAFTFKHALAQVKFTIQSALGDENQIVISNFSVTGFADKANLTYTMRAQHEVDAISWSNLGVDDSNPETPEIKTINALDNNVATTSNSAYGTYVVIPQTVTTLKMTFDATLYKADGTILKTNTGMTATVSGQEFTEGFRYNFIATIDGPDMGQISFDKIVVDEWKEYGSDGTGNGEGIEIDPNGTIVP